VVIWAWKSRSERIKRWKKILGERSHVRSVSGSGAWLQPRTLHPRGVWGRRGVFYFPSKCSAHHNGIPASSVSEQAALSNAAWSRGAEGFEMQSSMDFSPTPGSSSIAQPVTQACFPRLVVIPTLRRAMWLF